MAAAASISPVEIAELRKLCSDPFLELGSTAHPRHLACFRTTVTTKRVSVHISFPDDAAANRWNVMHETRIRVGGHIGTIALTAVLTYATGGMGWLTASSIGAGGAVLKDEIQATVWYPKVFRNWTLQRDYALTYQPGRSLRVDWTDVLRDARGVEQERRRHPGYSVPVGEPNGIPEHVVRNLLAAAQPSRRVVFR